MINLEHLKKIDRAILYKSYFVKKKSKKNKTKKHRKNPRVIRNYKINNKIIVGSSASADPKKGKSVKVKTSSLPNNQTKNYPTFVKSYERESEREREFASHNPKK